MSIGLTAGWRISAAAADTCQATRLVKGSARDRAVSVRFPDGRTITVVGHHHGNRQIYEIDKLEESGQLSQMSNSQFNELLQKILKENNEAIELAATGLKNSNVMTDAKEDLIILTDFLDSRKAPHPIQFVGVEALEGHWQTAGPAVRRAASALRREYFKRYRSQQIAIAPDDLEALILSSMNANQYLYANYPDIEKAIPIVGTEDYSVIRTNPDGLGRVDKAVKALFKADEIYWNSKTDAERSRHSANSKNELFANSIMQLINQVQLIRIDREELEASIKKLSPLIFPWLKDETESLFEAFRVRIKFNESRDYASARYLVGRYQSGLHFVGLNHLRNTVRNLESFCRAEMTRAPVYSQPANMGPANR